MPSTADWEEVISYLSPPGDVYLKTEFAHKFRLDGMVVVYNENSSDIRHVRFDGGAAWGAWWTSDGKSSVFLSSRMQQMLAG